MEKVLVVGLFLLVPFCQASVVPFTAEYSGQTDNYVLYQSNIYSFQSTEIQEGPVSFPNPHIGLTTMWKPSSISDRGIALVSYYRPPTQYSEESWSSGWVEGVLSVGYNDTYTLGSDLLLKMDYIIDWMNNPNIYPYYKFVGIYDQLDDLIWHEYATNDYDERTEVFNIPIKAGETYWVWMYQSIGTQSFPVTGQVLVGTALDFDVIIPEPATLLLFCLGSLIVRRRNR